MCTRLPIYQLSLFLQAGYRRFICPQCVAVPDYVKDIMSSKKLDTKTIQEELDSKEGEIKLQRDISPNGNGKGNDGGTTGP